MLTIVEGKPSELQVATAKLRQTQKELTAYYELDAKIKKARYDALVNNGFTPDQAIELLKSE